MGMSLRVGAGWDREVWDGARFGVGGGRGWGFRRAGVVVRGGCWWLVTGGGLGIKGDVGQGTVSKGIEGWI